MFKRKYLQELRRALIVRGIWGRPARKLIEEAEDHLHETAESLCKSGLDASVAEERALAVMGTPDTVAKTAADETLLQSALGRHPWLLGGLAVFLLAMATFALAAIFDAYLICKLGERSNALISTCVFMTNWGPIVVGSAFLVWMSMRVSTGWKALIVASGALGLALGAFTLKVDLPKYIISGETWAGALLYLAFGSRITLNPSALLNASAFARLLLPAAFCVTARWAISRRRAEGVKNSYFILSALLAVILLPGCVTYTKYKDEPRGKVRFSNREAAETFYTAYLASAYPAPRNTRGLNISLPLPFDFQTPPTDNVNFNKAVRSADTNQDGVISMQEAQEYLDKVRRNAGG